MIWYLSMFEIVMYLSILAINASEEISTVFYFENRYAWGMTFSSYTVLIHFVFYIRHVYTIHSYLPIPSSATMESAVVNFCLFTSTNKFLYTLCFELCYPQFSISQTRYFRGETDSHWFQFEVVWGAKLKLWAVRTVGKSKRINGWID